VSILLSLVKQMFFSSFLFHEYIPSSRLYIFFGIFFQGEDLDLGRNILSASIFQFKCM